MAILIGGLTAILNKMKDSVHTGFQDASQELRNVIGGQLKAVRSIPESVTRQGETITRPGMPTFNPPTP